MSAIDNIRATISKRGGLAPGNHFSVYMTPPGGGLLNLDLQGAITQAIRGDFGLNDLVNDPRDMAILCKSCSLPGRQITTLDYQSNKQIVKVPYSFINEDVTFTFHLTNDYYAKKVFDSWLAAVMDFDTYKVKYHDQFTTDVIIQQLDQNDIPIYSVVLEDAYPVTVNAINLDNSSENSTQEVQVTMTYSNFRKEGILESSLSIASQVIGQVANTLF